MKTKIILILAFFSLKSHSQDFMSTYNLGKREMTHNELFGQEKDSRDCQNRRGLGRMGKILVYTSVLAGGLVVANYATQQDYFVGNTMIYGTGGILTILATGIIISSVNGINKQLYFSVKKEGITMNLAIR